MFVSLCGRGERACAWYVSVCTVLLGPGAGVSGGVGVVWGDMLPGMWEYTEFLRARGLQRSVRLRCLGGSDCVYVGARAYLLPVGWWGEVWGNTYDLDPRFCYVYEFCEGTAYELCVLGREDGARVLLSKITWLAVEYYLVVMSPGAASVVVTHGVQQEVRFWERMCVQWDEAMRAGPWDMV